MTNNADKAALATLITELKTCEAPSSVHHDVRSVLALHITRQQTRDEVDQLIAEKLHDDLPVENLYYYSVLNGTTFVFSFFRDFLRAESIEYKRQSPTDRVSWGWCGTIAYRDLPE